MSSRTGYNNKFQSVRRQRGATMVGTLIIVLIIGSGLYAAIRLTPVYLEYFGIVRALEQVAKSEEASSTSPAELRKLLENRWTVEDFKSLEVKDIHISKVNDGYEMNAAYRAEAPFVGNISLVVDFDKTVEVR